MSEPKKYSLKKTEQTMLQVIRQQMDVTMANYMSTIAVDRLAYEVTPQTRFEFAPDFSEVVISQIEEKQPEPDTGVIDTPGKK